MQTAQQLFSIVGYPVGHSLSPAQHNWGFQQAEVPGLYMAWGIQAAGLADFFKAVRTLNIQGGSITVPHKVGAMRHMDKVTEQAKKMGAINAFFWKDGQLWGENTALFAWYLKQLQKDAPCVDFQARQKTRKHIPM